MPKTAGRKKKPRLESSTKYMAIGIVAGGALLVLAVVLPLVIYFAVNSRATDEGEKIEVKQPGLPEMIARTNALEVGFPDKKWKWWPLLNRRPNLPAQANGAVKVKNLKSALPKTNKYYKELADGLPSQAPNLRLTPAQLGKLTASLGQLSTAVSYIQNLPPRGAFPLKLTAQVQNDETGRTETVPINPYYVDFSHVDLVAKAIWLMEAEAILSLEQGNLVEADRSIKAILSMCRYLRYEYNTRSQLARLGGLIVATDLVERLIAQTPQPPFDFLTEYQNRLDAELSYNEFVEIMRAERGMFDALSDFVRSGDISWKIPGSSAGAGAGMGDPAAGMDECGGQEPDGFDCQEGMPGEGIPGDELGGEMAPPTQPGTPYVVGGIPIGGEVPAQAPDNQGGQYGGEESGDMGVMGGGGGNVPEDLDKTHAWYLGYVNEMVYLSREPTEDLLAKIANWKKKEAPKAPAKAKSKVPNAEEVAKWYLRKLAKVRATVMGIAAERYRLIKGNFPATLAGLLQPINPNDPQSPRFLSRVYDDPYTGNAMYYRIDPQKGAVVYAVGEDLDDDQVMFGPAFNTWADDSDAGFRIWNPTDRYKK